MSLAKEVRRKYETGQFDGAVWKEGSELVSTLTALHNHYQPKQKTTA